MCICVYAHGVNAGARIFVRDLRARVTSSRLEKSTSDTRRKLQYFVPRYSVKCLYFCRGFTLGFVPCKLKKKKLLK